MVIYFNNNELSTTPIFSTTLKDVGNICEYVKSDRGGMFLKVWGLVVTGLWLYSEMMKGLLHNIFYIYVRIMFIYDCIVA